MKNNRIIGMVCAVIVYLLSLLAASLPGFLSPYLWTASPVVAALLCAFSYVWLARRWRGPGLSAALSLVFAVFLLAFGEVDMRTAVLMVMVGVLSDVARRFFGSESDKSLFRAYPILALVPVVRFLPLWADVQAYYEGAVEEMGQDYAHVIFSLSTPWMDVAVVLCTLLAGVAGVRLAAKLWKS
ncbi:putative bacterial integral membrane protein [Segatella baroniae F0067]|uniref:Putative bacterial integral membrane protein n=1 Tax=Segatella baroniae F0067 TaxID=1115809 RepID=U2QA46_9BACT|nr:MptD family putative ECF transporter S component [Segatella baroniae]ERK38198.1 putative bacterial integral membrane protein [Segatella baroniae F0067]